MASKKSPVVIIVGVVAVGLLVALIAYIRHSLKGKKDASHSSCGCDGLCLCVIPNAEARCDAIQRLVRPAEVQHLSRNYHPFTMVNELGVWLRRQFASQILRYIPDPKECDRWCSPSETLKRGGGDCDDFAILVCSLLHSRGVDAAVMVGDVSTPRGPAGHAWVEGTDAFGWFLIEGTSGEVLRYRAATYTPRLRLRPGQCEVVATA